MSALPAAHNAASVPGVSTNQPKTADEVAELLRCSSRTVRERARQFGIGADFGGRIGWRFTDEDVQALLVAMRPQPTRRRQRRRAAS
ncbi:MAG TPA: helix-turn-helix domain-containing protein [Aeromicrobium sp.]|nr:helix-turn-helix domain-containing protein [Aeromicrobium sp.]HKY58334.1 helix-turn-helix domain-containing protein [Aeromicrobium sp.]